MATVHSTTDRSKWLLAMKGSPPEVLAGCTWYMKDGRRLPMSDEVRDEIQTANVEMAGRGLRALGMAHAVSDSKPRPHGERRHHREGPDLARHHRA